MYTYTTVVKYSSKDAGSDTRIGILAATTEQNIAAQAFKKALRLEDSSFWHIHSIEIFKTLSNHAIDFCFITSGANETMPVCYTRRSGGLGYDCNFGEFEELLRET
jgi:hypothetical protein